MLNLLTLKFNLVGTEAEVVVDETGLFSGQRGQGRTSRCRCASFVGLCLC